MICGRLTVDMRQMPHIHRVSRWSELKKKKILRKDAKRFSVYNGGNRLRRAVDSFGFEWQNRRVRYLTYTGLHDKTN
jgi:hypothetical protein